MLFVVLRILDNSKFLLSVGTLVELCLHIALDAKCKLKGLEVGLSEASPIVWTNGATQSCFY
jgi:hypothetical protein